MPESAVKKNVAAPTEISRDLAQHIAGLRYEDLPDYAVRAAKQFMLDTLAVAWAGSNSPGCADAHAMLADEGGRADGTVWAYGGKLPAPAAAFANSMFAAALDFDSLGRDAPSHVNIVVLPAALALAERRHVSGKEFLTALVAGSDLMCRLGVACESQGPSKGWFYTSVHGVFGSVAASARLMGLDAVGTRNAIGIAFSQAAGTQQANIEPSLTKRMQSGFASRSGVFAALLAARGLTAPRAVFEGQFGLFKLYQEGDAARLLDGLGSRFENGNLSIKKFPSCGCNHTALAGALQLTAEHDLQPDDIESIEVEVSPFINRLVGSDFDPSGDPQVAAQFNIRYSIACAITRRKFGLAELENDAVYDPGIGTLIERIKVVVDPKNKGNRGPIELRIRSRKHGNIACRVEHVPGSDEWPLSEREVADKCRECFALGAKPFTGKQTDLIMQRVANIEQTADMAEFFKDLL